MFQNLLIIFIILISGLNAQTFYSNNPLAHTYSIVARDTVPGEMGVAVQSHWYSVEQLFLGVKQVLGLLLLNHL